MVEREIDVAKRRWAKFKELIRRELPDCRVETLDEGRKERFWKIRLGRKIEGVAVDIIMKPRRTVMTHPEVDYENIFSKGIEEAKRILATPIPGNGFHGTILIIENDPFFNFKQGEKSEDDEW
jgi:hypothetical protein